MTTSGSVITYSTFVTIIFIGVAGMLLFPSNRYLPFDRRIACLFGAAICTLLAYCLENSINPLNFVDINVLLVLSAIMGINFLLLQHPWLVWIFEQVQWYICYDVDKAFYLVSFLSFFISQVIMNDGLCLMLVHPVLDAFEMKKAKSMKVTQDDNNGHHHTIKDNIAYHSYDPFYFMLNIACSANIGSVMTFAGNPQNLIIAQYLSNYMNCAVFYVYMIGPAVVTWIFTLGLINYYRKKAIRELKAAGENTTQIEMTGVGKKGSTLNEMERGEDFTEGFETEMDSATSPIHLTMHNSQIMNHSFGAATTRNPSLPDSEKYSKVIKEEELDSVNISELKASEANHLPTTPSLAGNLLKYQIDAKHLIFPAMLIPLIVLEFVGVIPLAGLFMVMSISMITAVIGFDFYLADHSSPSKTQQKIEEITHYLEDLFHSVDYNLLIIFTGLFIVSGSFLQTGIPSFFWNVMAGKTAFQNGLSVFIISIYVIVFSQLVGNVPLVYLAREEVQALDRQPQIFGWLILAYVSTIAGNFTLVGSAANIIVVEKAVRHRGCPVHIDAIAHFKICGIITLISITFGVLILYLEISFVG